jgi:hypothetical protein
MSGTALDANRAQGVRPSMSSTSSTLRGASADSLQ